MEFKDYYKILGVKPDADTKEIKTAYRTLARKYHPDMNPAADAADKFKEVAEAYEVLKDAGTRAEFDQLREYGGQSQGGFRPPPGWQSAGAAESPFFEDDYSDFFNSFFRGRESAFRQTHRASDRVKGKNVEIEMPVFLEETVSDNVKPVEYQIPVYEAGAVRNIKKHLKVKIPQGVVDGERIRVKGHGAPAPGGGAAGDLYLHIRLVPHPLFDLQGHNLFLTLPLAPWEAALGAKVKVPTLEGKIQLTIPPNTQSGEKMRIKGRGMKGKAITGDLYVLVKIVMPPTVDVKSRELWQKLSKTAGFDPRKEWGEHA